MSTETKDRLSTIVQTTLLSARPNTAAVRLTFGSQSHRLELDVCKGRFCHLSGAVETALEAWFHDLVGDLPRQQQERLRATVVLLIRERHEHQLPQPKPRILYGSSVC